MVAGARILHGLAAGAEPSLGHPAEGVAGVADGAVGGLLAVGVAGEVGAAEAEDISTYRLKNAYQVEARLGRCRDAFSHTPS